MLTYDKDRGITPLEIAAEKGSVKLVSLMLTYINFLINRKLDGRRKSIGWGHYSTETVSA